jgi:uncharacterized protein YcbK (DUF882 family)
MLTYFKPEEFLCKCQNTDCRKADLDTEFALTLDTLREMLGRPMVITSGVRCEKHNTAVGGAAKSKHVQRIAVDVSTNGWTSDEKYELIRLALLLKLGGVGLHSKFIHLDSRTDNKAVWLYGK